MSEVITPTNPELKVPPVHAVELQQQYLGGERTGGSMTIELNSSASLVSTEQLLHETGFTGSLVAEIKIGKLGDDGRVLAIIDARRDSLITPNGPKTIWSDPEYLPNDGGLAQIISSDIVLAQFEKTIDEQGKAHYKPVRGYKHIAAIGIPEGQTTIGREDEKLLKSGFLFGDTTSSRHMTIELVDSNVIINDTESLNGTTIVTAKHEKNQQNETTHVTEETEIGRLGLIGEVVAEPERKFKIDDVEFNYEGFVNTATREMHAFTSTDKDGKQRRFFVYRSNSEGGLRVSQGLEGNRIIKGPEGMAREQYTQDTQLHPDFEHHVRIFMALPTRDDKQVEKDSFRVDHEKYGAMVNDFMSQVRTDGMGDADGVVSKLDSGVLGMFMTEKSKYWGNGLVEYVAELNKALEQAGVLPDFTKKPTRTETDTHSVLGNIKREVFTSSLNGRSVEWYIGSDSSGKVVWIDRIRYADSKPTAFGTDAEMIDSGILTSKPFEYHGQYEAIPNSYIGSLSADRRYADISPFIGLFKPVVDYKRASLSRQ